MSDQIEDEFIKLALDVADTIHDMFDKLRCVLDTSQTLNVLQVSNRYKKVFEVTNVDIRQMVDPKNYLKIQKHFKVRDFEDAVIFHYNKTKNNNMRTTEDIIEHDFLKKLITNSGMKFMIDFLPMGCSEMYKWNGRINTIATYWDSAILEGKKTLCNNTFTSIPCIGTNYVFFENKSVILKDESNRKIVTCTFPFTFIQDSTKFSNGVKRLCEFGQKFKEIDNTNTELVRKLVVSHFFFKKIPVRTGNKRSYYEMITEDNLDKLAREKIQPFMDFLIKNNNTNNVLFKLFEIKRSGDYGQITITRELNKANQTLLLTGDRLCYLRAKDEKVPVVLLKPNKTICYACNINSDQSNVREQIRKERISKLNERFEVLQNYSEFVKITISTIQLIFPPRINLNSFTAYLDNYISSLNAILVKGFALETYNVKNHNINLNDFDNDTLDKYNDYVELIEFCQYFNDIQIKPSLPLTFLSEAVSIPKFIIVNNLDQRTIPYILKDFIDTLNSSFDFMNNDKNPFIHYTSPMYDGMNTNSKIFVQLSESIKIPENTTRILRARRRVSIELFQPFQRLLNITLENIRELFEQPQNTISGGGEYTVKQFTNRGNIPHSTFFGKKIRPYSKPEIHPISKTMYGIDSLPNVSEDDIGIFIDTIECIYDRFSIIKGFDKSMTYDKLISTYIKGDFQQFFRDLEEKPNIDAYYGIYDKKFEEINTSSIVNPLTKVSMPQVNQFGGSPAFISRNDNKFIPRYRHSQCRFLHRSQIGKYPFAIINGRIYRPSSRLVKWLRTRKLFA